MTFKSVKIRGEAHTEFRRPKDTRDWRYWRSLSLGSQVKDRTGSSHFGKDRRTPKWGMEIKTIKKPRGEPFQHTSLYISP